MRMKVLLAAALVARALFAVIVPSSGEVRQGEWNSSFERCKGKADELNVPMLAMVASFECTHCNDLETAMQDPANGFLAWMADHGDFIYYFGVTNTANFNVFAQYGDKRALSADLAKAMEFVGWGEFPRICLYWPQSGGEPKKSAFAGVDGKMLVDKSTLPLIDQFIGSLNLFFKDYSSYAAGAFVNGAGASDRLEARADTAWVDVPLKREGAGVAQPTNETLRVAFPGGASAEYPVVWAANESNKTVRVDLRAKGFSFAVGQKVELTLNSDGKTSPAAYVTLVGEPENNPKNPLWLGARTADTLKAGEWTMDFEVAKARAARKNAPLLVLVGGSLWCPDCVKVDHYLVEQGKFRDWLAEKDVSCVAIDVPNIASGKTTSLLTHDPTTVSDRYVTATKPNQDRVQSGAGYLSRNMIDAEDAAAVASRNTTLISTDVAHGGLCRLENMDSGNVETGPFKTGIPCLILMRPDGSIIGRIFQFNNVSPGDTTALDAYISRMNELLALADDTYEEDNADWRTTEYGISFRATVEETISAVDLADVYELMPFEYAVRGRVSVRSLTPKPTSKTDCFREMATEENVRMTLLKVKGGVATAVAAKRGNVFEGVSFDASCTPEEGVKWYVEVRALGTVNAGDTSVKVSKTFSLERKDDSTVRYELDVALKYAAATLGFEKGAVEVSEKSAGTVSVRVQRQDAVTGTAAAVVVLDEVETTALPGTYSYALDGEEDFVRKTVSWGDGQSAAHPLVVTISDDSVWDGDRKIVFRLEELSGSPLAPYAGETNLVITVREDDRKTVGKLAFAETKLTAIESTPLDVVVERINGAAGAYGAVLTATAGTLSSNRLDWANNDRVPMKHVGLLLPKVAETKGGVVTVTLTPDKGISAASGRKSLKIQLVERDCPRFEDTDRVFANAFRYVAVSNEIRILNAKGGDLKVTKVSGSLPAGIKAKLVVDPTPRLVVSGVPTAANATEAVYQVKETIDRVVHPGLTVKLTFNVRDPARESASGEPALNPSIAKSRTFKDQMVVDSGLRVLAGLLNVTLPTTGRASAKYRCADGTISLSAKSWSECDSETGVLKVLLVAAKTKHALSCSAWPDGRVEYELTDPVRGGHASGDLMTVAWSKTDPAQAFQGCYTVDCPARKSVGGVAGVVPTGDVWMTLKLTASAARTGKMTYGGGLPNGKTFSGSATLIRRTDAAGTVTAVLPVFYRTSADFFTAVPEIAEDAVGLFESDAHDHRSVRACADADPYWRHYAKETEDACFSVVYDLYGSYYDSSENVKDCAERSEFFGGTPLFFTAEHAVTALPVMLAKSGISIMREADNPSSVRLSFNARTGCVSGTFKIQEDGVTKPVSASFKGVLLPGWGGCSTCPTPGKIVRPLAVGSYWFSDKLPYEVQQGDGTSIERQLKVIRGGFIRVGDEE